MAKVILLVRASTLQQTVEAQTEELVKMAKADGYKDSDIYTIENKESGYRLSEEERLGLNRMKELIESDSEIECVYAWSVSRIGRNDAVNSSIKNYLVKRKIQLKTKSENVTLLDEDGTLNRNAELTFNIFSTLAKQGAEDIKAQTIRGKNKKTREGKSAQGKTLYGYRKDENGYIKVYEPEAKWIRYIFDEYVNNDIAVVNLYRELSDKGIFHEYTTERSGIERIRNILRNPSYCGGEHLKKKLYRVINGKKEEKKRDLVVAKIYPPIITKEMYEQAGEKLRARISKPKVNTKYIYYGSGLVRYMGLSKPHKMVPNRPTITYRLPEGPSRFSISINVIDSILWYSAVFLYEQKLTTNHRYEEIVLNRKMLDNDIIIDTAKSRIKDFEEEKERIDTMYQKSRITEEQYEKRDDEVQDRIKEQKQKIAKYESENTRIKKLLKVIPHKDFTFVDANAIKSITDDSKRKSIIQEVIDSIDIYPIEDGKCEIKINQSVNPLGFAQSYIYMSRGGKISLQRKTYRLATDEYVFTDASDIITKRFQRNDPKGDRHKDRKKEKEATPQALVVKAKKRKFEQKEVNPK